MAEKYLIVHMLTGPVREYHQGLVDSISDRFGIPSVTFRIGSHLTLKAPFDYDQIADIEDRLEEFCACHRSAKLSAHGFGFFSSDRKIIFLDILFSAEAKALLADYDQMLGTIPGLTFEASDQNRKLHATVAELKFDADFNSIWQYLNQSPQLSYPIDFRSISLLRHDTEASRWQVVREFSLR